MIPLLLTALLATARALLWQPKRNTLSVGILVVILAVLAGSGTEVAEYTPAGVKKAVTGNGRAPKEQVRSMVGRLLGPEVAGASTDLSDALAVALCHAASRRYREIEARSKKVNAR